MTDRKLSDSQVVKMVVYNTVHPDRILGSAKAGYRVQFGFFYKLGQSSKSKAEKVRKNVNGVKVTSDECMYNAWPKGSYFEVTFKVEDMAAVRAQFESQIAEYGCTPREMWAEFTEYVAAMKD